MKQTVLRKRLAEMALTACFVFVFQAAMSAQEIRNDYAPQSMSPEQTARAIQCMTKVPLSFVPNAGQSQAAVQFESKGFGGTVSLFKEGVILMLPIDSKGKDREQARSLPLGIRFFGANKEVSLQASKPLPSRMNFFYGKSESSWKTGIQSFKNVTYHGLYDGVDLLYNGTQGRLKGTYKVAPGADPKSIQWRYEGAKKLSLNTKGDLVVTLQDAKAGVDGKVHEEAPVAWQTIKGKKVAVKIKYELSKDGIVGFKVGKYDANEELVIDPFVVFSTLMGGNGTDHTIHLTMDAKGHVYVTGRTHSNPAIVGFGPGWPVTTSSFDPIYNGEVADAFAMKIDTSGTFFHWSAYLGGGDPVDFSVYSGADWGFDIQLDAAGDVHLVGFTEAANFPITANAVQSTKISAAPDAYYTVISADGSSILYSTYLGGTAMEIAYGVAIRSDGKACIAGWTESTDFPVTTGAYQEIHAGEKDGFMAIIDRTTGTIDYATYFGNLAADLIYDIGIGPQDYIYLAGETWSQFDLSLHPSLQGGTVPQAMNGGLNDGILGVIDPQSAGIMDLLYATFIGGSSLELIYSMSVDAITGEAFLTGMTESTNYPTVNSPFVHSGSADSFIARIVPQGIGQGDFFYNVVLGGPAFDIGLDITHFAGAAFYTGLTEQVTGTEAYWVRFGLTGLLEDGKLLGGSFYDMGLGIAVGLSGIATCGYTQCGNSQPNFMNCIAPNPFPLTNALIPSYGGGSGDGWVRKRSLF